MAKGGYFKEYERVGISKANIHIIRHYYVGELKKRTYHFDRC